MYNKQIQLFIYLQKSNTINYVSSAASWFHCFYKKIQRNNKQKWFYIFKRLQIMIDIFSNIDNILMKDI